MSSYSKLSRQKIEEIVKNGKSLHSPLFSVRVGRNKSLLNSPVVAFTVSKKIFPTAVLRNKAKRRAREAFRKVSKGIFAIEIVFFLKKGVITSKMEDLSKEMLNVLN